MNNMLKNEIEKYRKQSFNEDMKAILFMSMNKFGLTRRQVIIELAIIFMFTQLECEELRDFDMDKVNL